MRAILLKKNTISRTEKVAVQSFLKWQTVIAVLLFVGAVVFWGPKIAQSVLLGSLITIIPNLFLAIFLFARAQKRTAKQVVRACYVGELLKLVLIAIMMVIILHFFRVSFGPFLVGFIGTYVVYWMAPIILKQSGSKGL